MMRLLEIEFYKVKRYPTFYIFLGVYILLLPLIFGNFDFKVNETDMMSGFGMHSFPTVWKFLTYAAGFFNFIPALLIITLVANEYSAKTFRQQVINGLTRAELVVAKAMVVFSVSMVLTMAVLAYGLFLGFQNSEETDAKAILMHIDAVTLYFLQLTAYLSLAFLAAILLRRSGPAIMAFLAYVYMLEPIAGKLIGDPIAKYLPKEIFSSLTPLPILDQMPGVALPVQDTELSTAILLSITYLALIYLAAYTVLRQRDL